VSRIEKGEWTAVRVLQAYMSQAVRAHAKTNCLTEIMFEPALLRATQLDEEFSRSRKLVGPLHGVPLSLKDQCKQSVL
jgi:Asp-tRNA(Asn)/Glu-tRNA(Gln) amidotransferase A subunit family amidase